MRAPRMTTDYTASKLQPYLAPTANVATPSPIWNDNEDFSKSQNIASPARELGREPSGGKVRLTAFCALDPTCHGHNSRVTERRGQHLC